MPDSEDTRKLDQYVEINDPSDSVIQYDTNGIDSQEELEARLRVLIENHAVKFKGPLARFPEERFVEASFYSEWRGERKLVVVKGINGSYITSADARHGKGGRAERLRPGMAMLEIAGYEYAIEFGEEPEIELTVDEAVDGLLAQDQFPM
jgi:hypothetical protein